MLPPYSMWKGPYIALLGFSVPCVYKEIIEGTSKISIA